MSVPGGRRIDAAGHATGRLKTNSRQKIAGQFIAHRVDMISSPAWRALSLTARKILDRLEIEHAGHAGRENGSLIVTYDQFEEFGIRRKSIASGLRELVVLGFLEVTQRGRMAAAEFHVPSRYRLTYLLTFAPADGSTDEWSKITTNEEVAAALEPRRGKVASGAPHRRAADKDRPKTIAPVLSSLDIDRGGENAPGPVGAKTPPELRGYRGENAPGTRGENAPGKIISERRLSGAVNA